MSHSEDTSLEKLLDAAGRALQPVQPSWQNLSERLAQTRRLSEKRSRGLRPWLWLVPAPFGIAAAVALWIALGGGEVIHTGNLAQAQLQPVQVQRQDVELTVLSVTETEGETLYMPLPKLLGRPLIPPSNRMTPFGDDSASQIVTSRRFVPRPPPKKATGQALVKDHRLILNLQEGDNIVRFTEVAASIDPTSVRFVSNTDREGTVVVEQNFEYDLADGDALLKRYIDQKIVCVFKDGHDVNGLLASFDDSAIVLSAEPAPLEKGKNRQTQSLSRKELQAIRLDKPAGDLLVKPTLVWKLRTRTAGRHDTTVSYLCGLIKWQADYVAVITPGEGNRPDLLDLTGWVTLENRTGSTYEKAGLKLIAGDVHRRRDPWAEPERSLKEPTFAMRGALDSSKLLKGMTRKEFVEKAFFEYHMYTLSAPSTVRDQEIKQLSLLQRKGVKAQRRYVFDPSEGAVHLELSAKNEKENHLGLPLPKGRVTLEQRDLDGETGILGHTDLDHTAVKEEITLRYGHAFDVSGEYRQMDFQQLGLNHYTTTYVFHLRNHKMEEIRMRALAHLGLNWKILQNDVPFTTPDVNTVNFDLAMKPNSEQSITFKVEYQN